MTDVMVAIADGAYRFTLDDLAREAMDRWPATRAFPRAQFEPPTTDGTIQVTAGDGRVVAVDVGVLDNGRGLDIEGFEQEVLEFVAWLTTRPGFPDDGTVNLVGWVDDLLPLRRDMTADELQELRG